MRAVTFAFSLTILVAILFVESVSGKNVAHLRGNSSFHDTVHEHAQNMQNATGEFSDSSFHNKTYAQRARRSHRNSVSSKDNMQNIYNSIGAKPNRANWEMRRGVNKNHMKPNSLRNLLQLSGQGVSSDKAASTLDKFVTPPMPIPLPKVSLPVEKVTSAKLPIVPTPTAEHLTPVKVSLVDLFNSDLVDFRTIINSPDWQKKFKDLVIAIEAYESKYFENEANHAENSNPPRKSEGTDALQYNSFEADYESYYENEDDELDDYPATLPSNATKTSVIPEKTIGTWESEVHNLSSAKDTQDSTLPVDPVNKTIFSEFKFDEIADVPYSQYKP
mgnify:CR=1 FL=1